MIVLYVLVALGILSIFFLISIYNRLVSLAQPIQKQLLSNRCSIETSLRFDSEPC
jgi:hypothetical protein